MKLKDRKLPIIVENVPRTELQRLQAYKRAWQKLRKYFRKDAIYEMSSVVFLERMTEILKAERRR